MHAFKRFQSPRCSTIRQARRKAQAQAARPFSRPAGTPLTDALKRAQEGKT